MNGLEYLRRRFWSVLLGLFIGTATVATSAPGSFTSASLAGLVDASGRVVHEGDFSGKYRIVLFGFSSCADVCPLTLLAIKEAMFQLGPRAAQVVPVFISVDPERDRGAALEKYVRAFDPRIRGLTGTAPMLQKVAAGYGVFFEKRWVDVSNNAYVYDHTASVLVVDPDGKLLASVSTTGSPPEVARRIVAALQGS
ncbi:MAG: SCO family protein [Steroidobacteraceae bacterium]